MNLKEAVQFIDNTFDGYSPAGSKAVDVIGTFVTPDALKGKARCKAEAAIYADAAEQVEINRKNRAAVYAMLRVVDEAGYQPAPMGSLETDELSPHAMKAAKDREAHAVKIVKEAKAAKERANPDAVPVPRRYGLTPAQMDEGKARRDEGERLAHECWVMARALNTNAKTVARWAGLNKGKHGASHFAKSCTERDLLLLRKMHCALGAWRDGVEPMPEELRVGTNGRLGRIVSGLPPELEKQRRAQRKYRKALAARMRKGAA